MFSFNFDDFNFFLSYLLFEVIFKEPIFELKRLNNLNKNQKSFENL